MYIEGYNITIDQQAINKDITLYQSVMLELFDKNKMLYTVNNFYSFVDKNGIDIIRNTFYNNRSDIEKGYRNFIHKGYDKKASLAADMYYLRLENYFLSVSKVQAPRHQIDGNGEKTTDNTFFSHLYVTENFFPLYIALISSNSKNTKWECMATSVKELYKRFFAPYEQGKPTGSFGTLNYEKAHELYTYWLDLLLPQKLYELISKVENTLSKEKDQPTEFALKHNLNLFMDKVSRASFFSKAIQNEFLTYANYIFDEFCKKRKKGISHVADSLQNKTSSMKVHIADDLIEEILNFQEILTTVIPIPITETGK